jgi:hypothetical protein
MVYIYVGFYRRWNRTVGRRHPNLWVFIRKLKDEEVKCRVAIRSGQRGAAPPNKKRRYRQLQERVDRLKDGYQRGTRSLNNYWAAVAHAVHDFS